MNKCIVTVLGKDRPGIISLVTNALYELDCNLENVNQMILQNQFAGFFIVEAPDHLVPESFSQALNKKAGTLGLTIHVDRFTETRSVGEAPRGEIYLITTIGPDQKGLVARFSKIIARHNANIENLRAVFKGGQDPNDNIMSYQVSVTPDIDTQKLFSSLRRKAEELNLDIRIQHRNIFDVINKI